MRPLSIALASTILLLLACDEEEPVVVSPGNVEVGSTGSSSTGEPEEEPSSTPMQPEAGIWSECSVKADCGETAEGERPLACVPSWTLGEVVDGVCAQTCSWDEECPDSLSAYTEIKCVSLGGGKCMMTCHSDAVCLIGQTCRSPDDGSPERYCF